MEQEPSEPVFRPLRGPVHLPERLRAQVARDARASLVRYTKRYIHEKGKEDPEGPEASARPPTKEYVHERGKEDPESLDDVPRTYLKGMALTRTGAAAEARALERSRESLMRCVVFAFGWGASTSAWWSFSWSCL